MSIKNTITRFVSRSGHQMKRGAPTVLTFVGIGALLAAGVMAARATQDLGPEVTALEEDLGAIARREDYRVVTMPDDEKADMMEKVRTYGRFSLSLIKLYGPSLALAAGGAAAILYSHGVMKKREASIVAAYGVLQRVHAAYRERVEKSFGPDVEADLNDGKVVEVTKLDAKTGQATYTTTETKQSNDDYIFDFGPQNKHWNPRPEWNVNFLRTQEKFANHRLHAEGFVFLNDVLESLGIEKTSAGAVTGWMADGPDGAVDFGLFEKESAEEADYLYFFNEESYLLLDFNVDGLIWDKIGKKR